MFLLLAIFSSNFEQFFRLIVFRCETFFTFLQNVFSLAVAPSDEMSECMWQILATVGGSEFLTASDCLIGFDNPEIDMFNRGG